MMLTMVSLIIAPAVAGATFPGSDKAHITLSPCSFAASKSTPRDGWIGPDGCFRRLSEREKKRNRLLRSYYDTRYQQA